MVAAQDSANRWPITISVMLATMMTSLDTTIANVALPHIQGGLSASQEQITWVLTSYIVAAAIATPLTGWLADRLGRKRLFIITITGFTVASMVCGIAANLWEIVAARLLQGVFGAALIPLSQAILLDINPPEKHGQAMSIWGAGAIIGPVIGPALGGWLTEYYSWRWCFFINLPIGLLALGGVWLFISGDKPHKPKPFDFLGFGSLVIGVGAIQLMLDRGPSVDWFESWEIWGELLLAIGGFWVFVFHTLSAEHPFFDRSLAKDLNFVTATVFGFFLGMMLYSALALLPPLMQTLLGYPVLTAGLINVPRGIGVMVATLLAGRLIGRLDSRLIIFIGLALMAFSTWEMTHFDLMMTAGPLVTTGIVQGFGIGLIFVPLSTLAFASVRPSLRGEASSLYNLIRNLGSSVGISSLQAVYVTNAQVMHASLAERVNPTDPAVAADLAGRFDLGSVAGVEALNAEVTRQAAMVAYIDAFKLIFILSIVCMPMLLFMRRRRNGGGEPVHVHID